MNDPVPRPHEPRYRTSFWVGLAVGVPVIVYGIVGVLGALSGDALVSFVTYFVGAAIVHDLLVGPAVCLVAWFGVRRIPVPARAPVQAALIASGVVLLVSWPFVRRYGVTPGEPSFLSRDYTASLVGVLAAVWLLTGAVVATRLVTARRR